MDWSWGIFSLGDLPFSMWSSSLPSFAISGTWSEGGQSRDLSPLSFPVEAEEEGGSPVAAGASVEEEHPVVGKRKPDCSGRGLPLSVFPSRSVRGEHGKGLLAGQSGCLSLCVMEPIFREAKGVNLGSGGRA